MDFGWPKRHHSGSRQRSRSRSRNRGRFYTQPINPTQLNPVEPSVKDATPEGIAQNEAFKKTVNERNPYFMVQLAQGSKTHTITDVRSTNQLYEKVVECFPEVALDDILYLTVGTYKPDMTAVVAGQLNFGDLIFVHLKGEKRVVELLKTERLMGMTISDNGAGKCFVKKLKPGSTAEKARPAIDDGMHIEKVNDTSVVGMRHYEVANLLREIPIGQTSQLVVTERSRHILELERSQLPEINRPTSPSEPTTTRPQLVEPLKPPLCLQHQHQPVEEELRR